MANRGSVLTVNDYLRCNDCLVSANGQFFAIMQSDGNLCVYEGTPDNVGNFRWGWTDWSRNQDDYFAIMQSDGNLCVYWGSGPHDNRSFLWGAQSDSLGEGWYFTVMQDDGNLCVYRGTIPTEEAYVWSWMDAYSHLFRRSTNFWDQLKSAVYSVGDLGSQAGRHVVSAASTIDEAFHGLGDRTDDTARAAWQATSETASGVAQGAQQAGVSVSRGFMSGADATRAALETGAEKTAQGLVEAGHYVNQNACSIAVGSALTAAVTAGLGSGSATVPVASLAAMATHFRDETALRSCAAALGHILAEPVCLIPIPGLAGRKAEVRTVIAFLIAKAVRQNPGQGFLVGALIYGLTEFLCSGKVPGGYSVWRGAQAEVPVM